MENNNAIQVFTNTPNQLKKLEIDVEKKIFNINGIPFGKGTSSFDIHFDTSERTLRMTINTTVHFASYDTEGKKKSEEVYEIPPQDLKPKE